MRCLKREWEGGPKISKMVLFWWTIIQVVWEEQNSDNISPVSELTAVNWSGAFGGIFLFTHPSWISFVLLPLMMVLFHYIIILLYIHIYYTIFHWIKTPNSFLQVTKLALGSLAEKEKMMNMDDKNLVLSTPSVNWLHLVLSQPEVLLKGTI